jgi:hypothetical protein
MLKSILLIILAAVVISCEQKDVKSYIESDNTATAIPLKKAVEKKKTIQSIEINEGGPMNYSVKIGQILSYSYKSHVSTGTNTNYELSNKDVLILSDEDTVFDEPTNASMPGGDASTVTLYFNAIKEGTCKLIIRHEFRGELKRRLEITIHVKK